MADLISMLSAASGATAEADPNFKQTVLLLHGDGTNGAQNNTFLDSSTNNFTITRNGNTTQGTFSPFSVGAGEWSNFFDGTDDYLSVADNAVLRPGAGAFTLEAWIYRNVSGAAHTVYAKGGASTGIVLQVTSGNVLRFTHTTTNIDSTGTVAANAWVHVAVVREGTGTNQTKLYINGVQDGQGTVSTDFTQTEEVRIGTNRGATEDFAGYISNVRFVKGSALYTAGFTPSTVPLTTTSQGASSSEVELLTCQSNRFVDNSTNAFAITRNGDVRVTPFSPFAPTAAYSAGTNGGSGYFDGTGDYLVTPNNTALQLGTGEFTIEAWFYGTAAATTGNIISSKPVGGNDSTAIAIYCASGNIYIWNNGPQITATVPPANVWNHVAATRNSSNVLTLWVNGVSVGTLAGFTANLSKDIFAIGALTGGGEVFSGGYISSVRVLKGTCLYTGTFTPPTAPLTAITNTSLLCNFTNAGIIDNTGKNNLETVGNAQIDTTTKKYGTGSLEFDGSGDFVKIVPSNSPNIDISVGNFTIECWVYFTTFVNDAKIFIDVTDASNYAQWNYSTTTGMGFVVNAVSVASQGNTNGWSTGTWYHVALVRNGNTYTIYRDGLSIASGTRSGALGPFTSKCIGGSEGFPTTSINGFIDDLRITKGVARYTANFTAPTKAFPDQ